MEKIHRTQQKHTFTNQKKRTATKINRTRIWANANVMAALPNIGGALCSTPQSLADAHYYSAMQ